MHAITGGADGLFGYDIAPLLGRFDFDLAGRTGYWYAAAVMAVVFFLSKAVVNSPFGLTIRGIRENPLRMRMLGVPDTFAPTGTAEFLLEYFGLTAAGIERAALDLLGKEEK